MKGDIAKTIYCICQDKCVEMNCIMKRTAAMKDMEPEFLMRNETSYRKNLARIDWAQIESRNITYFVINQKLLQTQICNKKLEFSLPRINLGLIEPK